MRCTGCDNNIPDGVKFCPICGARQPNAGASYPRGQGYVPPQQYRPPAVNFQQQQDLTSPCYVEFLDAVKLYFKNYVNFKGRSTRSEYWYAYLFTMLVNVCCYIIDFCLPIKFFSSLAGLAFLLPTMAVMFRRFHDTNRSGAMVIVIYVVNFIWGLLFGAVCFFSIILVFGGGNSSWLNEKNLFILLGAAAVIALPALAMFIYQIVICCQPSVPNVNKYGRAAE